MMFAPAPYLLKDVSVSKVMTQVCLALLPGIAAYVWLIGPAILIQLLLASLTALLAEGLMLRLQGKPLGLFLADGSAIVTAWLIALAFPPLAPWWLIVTGTAFAIVVAKQLYGGLGQNPVQPGDDRLCRVHRCFSGTDVAMAPGRTRCLLYRAMQGHFRFQSTPRCALRSHTA